MPKLLARPEPNGTRYVFDCPGCRARHAFWVQDPARGPSWVFDGDMESPTVSPSVLVRGVDESGGDFNCHIFIRRGQIEFLGDCTHPLAGQIVAMEDVESSG